MAGMIPKADTYADAYQAFRWQVPERYNIAADVCDAYARDADRVALIVEADDGSPRTYSFRDIQRDANRLANLLVAKGVEPGDRVAILLGQTAETAIAHVAIYKLGGIAMPLFTLFGGEALEYRLGNSDTRLLITNRENFAKVVPLMDRLPSLESVLLTDGAESGAADMWAEMGKASDQFTTRETLADDPALLIYTSGTTGPPKGALHAHRVLLGHMPGMEFLHDYMPQPGDLFWSPADWAWAGGLLDVLLPAWHHGLPVVAFRGRKFDPEQAFHMIAKHRVRNTLLMPTMLKMMAQVPDPMSRYDVELRSIFTGGEAVGAELLAWADDTFGIHVNEGYGQTECNLVIGNCSKLMTSKPGALGLPVPGHVAAIVDDDGNVLPAGETGQIGFKAPDPVMLLEYWRNPEATRDKFANGWLLMGDEGMMDDDGYIWFKGRADDVITSAGYRIGPGEIEDCLTSHPSVALAAAIGVPDPNRTEIIKAFLVPAEGVVPTAELEAEIRDYVRTRLAAHEYPRLIEFVDGLPTTATGKIMRRELRQAEMAKQSSPE